MDGDVDVAIIRGEYPWKEKKILLSREKICAICSPEDENKPLSEIPYIATCVEMVSRGLGWAIVPEICLKEFHGCIRPLTFNNGEPFVRSTYLLYTEEAMKLPQVNAFINTVRKTTC